MNTTPRTETTALIAAMEHWAKTISKNGGIAAVTIQEGADRLRELEAELVRLRAEKEKLKDEIFFIGAKPMFYQPNSYAAARAAEIQQERELEYVAQIRCELAAMTTRAEKAEAECLEQARLLGMSGSREASLLSKISQLERQLEKNNS